MLSEADLDATMAFYSPDAVYEVVGLRAFEGRAAIRDFLEDWWSSYEVLDEQRDEVVDLGNGVCFQVLRLNGRLAGSTSVVQERLAFTSVWTAGLVERVVSP